MISDAMEYIRREVVAYLGIGNGDVVAGYIHLLKEDNTTRGLYMSLVNLEEEATLRNTSHAIRHPDNTVTYREPPLFLNVYLLFAANFSNYDTSLLRLSQTIELFQSKRMFEAANASAANPFPITLEKLIFDFYNLNTEQLNNLWSVLGGAYLPSVVYKMRMVRVQRDESVSGPPITTIRVDSELIGQSA